MLLSSLLLEKGTLLEFICVQGKVYTFILSGLFIGRQGNCKAFYQEIVVERARN